MWQKKRKVHDEGGGCGASPMAFEIDSACSGARRSRKNGSKKELRQFFRNLGSSIESLIDATPLGVPDPVEPWSPTTDKRKALLSNPISVLNTVVETIESVSPAKFLGRNMMNGSSAWMLASSKMLMSLREGLANAVIAEEAMCGGEKQGEEGVDEEPVMVEREVDAVVTSGEAGGEAYIDLGADKWGNTSRAVNPAKEAVTEAKKIKKGAMKKILAFIDNLTLRANGIVVTSDDCSVECSLESLVDDVGFELPSPPSPDSRKSLFSDDGDESFEDCPSVVTEGAEDDGLDETQEGATVEVITNTQVLEEEEAQGQEEDVDCSPQDLVSDEDEYILADEPDSEDEDFVLCD